MRDVSSVVFEKTLVRYHQETAVGGQPGVVGVKQEVSGGSGGRVTRPAAKKRSRAQLMADLTADDATPDGGTNPEGNYEHHAVFSKYEQLRL